MDHLALPQTGVSTAMDENGAKDHRVNILLVDDHPVVRAGIRQILSTHFPADFVEADTAQAALEACARHNFDLMLLDVSMPGRSGLDLLVDIRAHCRELPVLIMSIHGEEQYARRALKAGAAGYIIKSSSCGKLVKAERKVLAGGTYVSPELAESLASSLGHDETEPPHETLSPREFEVFRLIVEGKSGKDIAGILFLSFKTVSTYRTRIFQKLGMASTAELAQYAAQQGLI